MTERIPQEAIDAAREIDVGQVASRYGFALTGVHGEQVGPCPGCGGRDRFSVNTKTNVWRCRQGGGDPIGGDAVALVRHVENCSFPRAMEILLGEIDSLKPRRAAPPAADNEFREQERRRAFQLWREGRAFPDGGAVARYLAARGLDPALARLPGAHCREHDDLPYWQPHVDGPVLPGRKAKVRWRVVHRGPAMLWPITARDGHFIGLHATWLDPAGAKGKAEIFCPDTGEQLPAKKVRGSKKGGRIVLRDNIRASERLAVGEGIESVLSWFAMKGRDHSLETSVDLGNLAGKAARTVAHPTATFTRRDGREMKLRVPGPEPKPGEDQALLWAPHPGVMRLTLIGDGDSDPVATKAAMLRAKARLSTGVPPDPFDIVIDWPPAGHDFNSLLMSTAHV